MELTAEQINDFLSKAILESQIGEAVKASVARVLADLNKTYQNPFDGVIQRHVMDLIDKELREHYAPLVEERVKESLSKSLTDEVIQKIVDAGLDRLRKGY